MTCDKLQRHSVRGEMYNGEEICGGFAYYDADEVDAILAEMVDAGMRERRLRRALWLTRAERAKEHYHRYHGRFLPDLKLTDIPEYNKWVKVEQLCRAKAEEYK